MTIEDSKREFGNRVKKRREEIGMTMDELARLMGYGHRSSIQKIESGENSIPQDKVALLANCLKTTTQKLMGWTDGIYESERDVAEYFFQMVTEHLDNIVPVDSEFDMIRLYRLASDRDKKLIDSILNSYKEETI